VRQIFDGAPGTVWTNTTDRVMYQIEAMLDNTCGVCLQYHLKIGPFWPIPIHHGCNCEQHKIRPGAEAPFKFVDYRRLLEGMLHDQQVAAIGASNYRLLDQGLVVWEDIVTPSRVRDLREVVAIKKLTVHQMVRAGVNPRYAEEAHESVHTPEHELVERKRQELIDRLKKAGVSQDALTRALSEGIASRVSIAEGPAGQFGPAWREQGLPGLPTSHVGEMTALLAALKRSKKEPPEQPPPAAPMPPPKPPGPPPGQPVLPGRPIQERLDAWTEGDDRVKAIQDLGRNLPSEEDIGDARHEAYEYADSLKPGDRRRKAVREKLKALEARVDELEQWRYRTDDQRRKALLKIAEPRNRADWSQQAMTPIPKYIGEHIDKGFQFVKGLVNDPDGKLRLGVRWRIESSDCRADCKDNEVRLAPYDKPRTVAHELGHVLEHSIPGATAAAKEFLSRRAKGEVPRKLKDLFPDHKFDVHEEGIEDEFGKYFSAGPSGGRFGETSAWYAGKHYPLATEVISMGTEALYEDPVGFATHDPQYCKWILGLLSGEMR